MTSGRDVVPGPADAAATHQTLSSAHRELEKLLGQVASARDELRGLREEIALANSDEAVNVLMGLLRENERLSTANSRAASDMDTANAALERAVRASELDCLTGLPNRSLTLERLQHDMVVARRHGVRLAVLFLDLNRFKFINDTYGHAVGDLVLQHVSAVLHVSVRASDTVSRHGGDEFLIVLSEVSRASDAQAMADKIASALASPLRIGDIKLHMSISIGFSLYPDHAATPEGLIRAADEAMYQVKRAECIGQPVVSPPLGGNGMEHPKDA